MEALTLDRLSLRFLFCQLYFLFYISDATSPMLVHVYLNFRLINISLINPSNFTRVSQLKSCSPATFRATYYARVVNALSLSVAGTSIIPTLIHCVLPLYVRALKWKTTSSVEMCILFCASAASHLLHRSISPFVVQISCQVTAVYTDSKLVTICRDNALTADCINRPIFEWKVTNAPE